MNVFIISLTAKSIILDKNLFKKQNLDIVTKVQSFLDVFWFLIYIMLKDFLEENNVPLSNFIFFREYYFSNLLYFLLRNWENSKNQGAIEQLVVRAVSWIIL